MQQAAMYQQDVRPKSSMPRRSGHLLRGGDKTATTRSGVAAPQWKRGPRWSAPPAHLSAWTAPVASCCGPSEISASPNNMPRTVVPQCLVLHSTGSGQSGPARPEALATPLRYQSVTAQRGCHVTRFGDTRAVMTWNPRGSQGTASRAMWSGKEMTLLSPPPRTTVRIRHRGHGSSN